MCVLLHSAYRFTFLTGPYLTQTREANGRSFKHRSSPRRERTSRTLLTYSVKARESGLQTENPQRPACPSFWKGALDKIEEEAGFILKPFKFFCLISFYLLQLPTFIKLCSFFFLIEKCFRGFVFLIFSLIICYTEMIILSNS